jgi:hypothetical protein
MRICTRKQEGKKSARDETKMRRQEEEAGEGKGK